jgi:hypothetical protein
MRLRVIIFLSMIFMSFSASSQVLKQKNISENNPVNLELKPYELHFKSLLKEIVTIFSLSKDIQVKVINSKTAIEYQVYYPPEDHKEITFLSGIRLRSIRQLFNELSISFQKQLKKKEGKEFDYYDRKILLITFHNRGVH